ncbi:MAG TPA: isocitrate lyase/phosphoenolpyruvate mutase family protein [Acidimicrobiales bacterium]|nr:isocitrate lyase/phosphoenolpyruvate mutase family protein [Acidimicrobiales bacterium]
MTASQKVERFHALHAEGGPLLMPNPWDIGSAKLLASIGFKALATTSSGLANSLGRNDGHVTREEAIAHGEALAAAVDVPVSADLENAFGEAPDDVAETVRLAVEAGLAGCSVEDYEPERGASAYDLSLAADRVRAAAEAAHSGPGLVLTARAENFVRGNRDLADTIARLQAFQEAGADVLFAPGVVDPADLRTLLAEVDRPVNVIATRSAPTIDELAALGVARVSVGGGFALVAYTALIEAGRELFEQRTTGFWDRTKAALEARTVFD